MRKGFNFMKKSFVLFFSLTVIITVVFISCSSGHTFIVWNGTSVISLIALGIIAIICGFVFFISWLECEWKLFKLKRRKRKNGK